MVFAVSRIVRSAPMSRFPVLLFLVACGNDAKPAPAIDPLVLASDVAQSELETTIQDLVAMQTRYTMSQGDEMARDYLVDRAETMGLVAELDPFQVTNQTANNVIIKVPGTTTPENVYIYSAHYDSTSNQAMTNAPGADDNATGVAGVLEAARVMSKHRYANTIWFVFTAAEEQGSLGSKHLVQVIQQQGVTVKGVIAPDMIGYWPQGESDAMDILGDPASSHLVDRMADVAMRMGVPFKKYVEHTYCYGDDHTSFQEAGIPAISPMDCVEAHNIASAGEDTPHYHKPTDTFDTLHMPFTTKVAQVIVATLAELAEPVAPTP